MEIPLAVKAGLGWRGKHTLLLNRERGSLFFLGEIYTAAAKAQSAAQQSLRQLLACHRRAPDRAITAPHRLDAALHQLTSPSNTRAASGRISAKPMANRIYGCDDCQLVCPWNKFAHKATVPDFRGTQRP